MRGLRPSGWILTAAALVGPGCGRTAADAVPATDASGAEVAAPVNCGTYRSNSCAPGTHCYGDDVSCGSVWRCQSTPPLNRCTAGITGLYCGCDGLVTISDGCPLRFHYSLVPQFPVHSNLTGRPCDPTRAPPYPFTYRIEGRALESFEGQTIHGVFSLPPAVDTPELRRRHSARIEAGGFAWLIKPTGPLTGPDGRPLHQDYAFSAFLDANDDGRCSAGVDARIVRWERATDLIALEFRFATDGTLARPIAPTDTSYCSLFEP